MSSQKAEIKACTCHWLGELSDEPMASVGFFRPKHSLVYSRTVEDAADKIDVAIEHHPSEQPDAAAAIYPQYTISMDVVNNVVEEMTGGDPQLGGQFSITMRGPIEWTSPKGIGARWHVYQPDSVSSAVSSLRDFLMEWTVPFLNKYRTPVDLCDAAIEGDDRDIHSQMEILRVVAAKVLCGRLAEALDVMERWFGKPGPRKRYRPVFEYLAALRL